VVTTTYELTSVGGRIGSVPAMARNSKIMVRAQRIYAYHAVTFVDPEARSSFNFLASYTIVLKFLFKKCLGPASTCELASCSLHFGNDKFYRADKIKHGFVYLF